MPVVSQTVIFPSEEHYPRFREVCGDSVHDTYADFVRSVQPKLDVLEAQGVKFIKMDVDPDAMAEWCRSNFGQINAGSRSAYAAYLAMEQDKAAKDRQR